MPKAYTELSTYRRILLLVARRLEEQMCTNTLEHKIKNCCSSGKPLLRPDAYFSQDLRVNLDRVLTPQVHGLATPSRGLHGQAKRVSAV